MKAMRVAARNTKKAQKGEWLSLRAFCGYQMLAEEITMYGSLEMSFAVGR
jgi:hypothetical protein